MAGIPEGAIWDLDRTLLLAVNGSWGGFWDGFWYAVSEPVWWIPVYVVMIWAMYRKLGLKGLLWALLFVVVALALADQTANFFKGHTPKFRPSRTLMMWEGRPFNEWVHIVNGYTGGRFGTVSGHAATAMAIALTSAGIYRRRWFSWMVGAYVVLTCFSRMYLGVHFPLDIIFGLTAGTLIGLLMIFIWRRINDKWNIQSARAPLGAD